jgi:hypothetical protein
LGGSVYARSTENGAGVTNQIALDPQTLLCFEMWLTHLA